ncbi:MAG: trypsin-like peptidase domain-containing protein [Pirellula sp.]|jgi:S1-C subfamily serine protease
MRNPLLVLVTWFIVLSLLSYTSVADPPQGLEPLIRFYNHSTNEHCYSHKEYELADWRKQSFVKEHYPLGLVATRAVPGTVRLTRATARSGRHYYFTRTKKSSSELTIDEKNFEVFVWTSGGDNRIPVYGSTWTDNGDVYLELNKEYVDKFTADSQKALGVTRKSLGDSPIFWVYPMVNDAAPKPSVAMADSPATSKNEIATKPPAPTLAPKANDSKTDESSQENLTSDSNSKIASSPDEIINFLPLSIEGEITSYTITEDHRFLIIALREKNEVLVWQVASEKIVKRIKTPAPSAILSRGDHLFVANSGQKTISQFSQKKGFVQVDQFLTSKPNMVHLSAPHGKHFTNQIIVSSHGEGVQGSYSNPETILLDTKGDSAIPLNPVSLATYSYDGKLVLTQSSFNLSPGGEINVYASASFLKRNPQSVFPVNANTSSYLYQAHEGGAWITVNQIYSGTPLKLQKDKLGDILVPELSNKVVYSLTNNKVIAYKLDASLTELGDRTASWPQRHQSQFDSPYNIIERQKKYQLDHPVAITDNGQTQFFVLDATTNTLLTAKTPAFLVERPQEKTSSSSLATNTAENMPEANTLGVPEFAVEGKPFTAQLPATPDSEYELMTGPQGLTISKSGLLSWTPTPTQLGPHILKIRVSANDQVSFLRPKIEVVNRDMVASGKPPQSFSKLDLEIDHYDLSVSHDRKNLLLLQGEQLRVLGPDGITVVKTIKLPSLYRQIKDRGSYMVALSKQPAGLALIDKKTGQLRKSIPLESKNVRVLDVLDIAVHPTEQISYVTIRNDVNLPRNRLLVVDEQTGEVFTSPESIGTWIHVDPTGSYLYAGYEDLYERGANFIFNPGGQFVITPDYGNIDWLMSYQIDGKRLKLTQIDLDAGGNGSGLSMSPDGKRLTYLSFAGTPTSSKNLAAWNAANLDEAPVSYPTKDIATTSHLAFHPRLNLAAVPSLNSAVIFDRETGQVLPDRLQMTSKGFEGEQVEDVSFSPDGQALLFIVGGFEGRSMRKVGLRLSEQEKDELRKPLEIAASKKRPSNAPPTPRKKIAASELDSLKNSSKRKELDAREINQEFQNSIVFIQSGRSVGTGFVVGRDGYVLTCAHVLTKNGSPMISYLITRGDKQAAITAEAEVIQIDTKRDLALLKIEPSESLKPILLSDRSTVESGEEVTVIGNPSVGGAVLTHTLTTGVVSNIERQIDDQSFIQTSAAVNPGNSGGPVFDRYGKVIGLVVLKARIEAAAFAVPARELRLFLQSATKR